MKYLGLDISCLKFEDSIMNIFKNNNILTVKDLWILTKNDLKNLGFEDNVIKKIVVKLQLFGLDLNKRKY